ncbi:MAG: O-antigen ligase domain-containing protein [Clostridia bacterium]|nr:O-antigen ligase domain-containing protein [Clostridia bacterium]
MSNQRVLPYGVEDEAPPRPKKVPPSFVTFLAIACTVFAGLGDWKTLNNMLGGLPKIIAMGTIACAFLNFLVDSDFINLKKAAGYLPIFLLLIAAYLFVSMYIWISDFTKVSAISRAGQKILFQTITIIYAVCMCYLFETRAIEYLFLGMCITNGMIMLLEVPKYGVAQSILSVVTCVVTFGDASGYVRDLEIHDITFLFGQFLIYFFMFAPKDTAYEKKKRLLCMGLCVFFMLVGLKRSTFPAVGLMCVYIAFLRKLKKPQVMLLITGIGLFLFFYVYVYLVREGIMVELLESLGVDMLGRDTMWLLPNQYYEFSPFWKGLGFEAVNDLVTMWVKTGVLSKSLPLHNDILKVFIELGAMGFTLWAGIQYIVYPIYWMKHYDVETAMLYCALLFYMSVTYLTDNTAFYFWSCIGLRLIPMSYSYRIFKVEKQRRWKALSSADAADFIWNLELEGAHKE